MPILYKNLKKLLLLSFEKEELVNKKIIIHKNFENNSKINKLSAS